MSSGEIVFTCKYCRKPTVHITVRGTEIGGYKGSIVKCMVCEHESAVYRRKGKLDIDQSEIPERHIMMPWDDDYVQMKQDMDSPSSIRANEDIDDWLKHPVGYFPGIKRGRWGLKT